MLMRVGRHFGGSVVTNIVRLRWKRISAGWPQHAAYISCFCWKATLSSAPVICTTLSVINTLLLSTVTVYFSSIECKYSCRTQTPAQVSFFYLLFCFLSYLHRDFMNVKLAIIKNNNVGQQCQIQKREICHTNPFFFFLNLILALLMM